MAYVKYTREMLSEAVAASISMAGVLRHLGLPQNGGAHAHLRRRINQFGIETSHFLGQAHLRGTHSLRRRHHTEVLVLRPIDAKREKPKALRRALEETGRPYLCAECGIDDSWNGRPLTLHVDHIDGQFWDCRIDNLRFLCPNCHGQTATYAGRNRQRSSAGTIRVDAQGNAVDLSGPVQALSDEEKVEVLARVDLKEVTVTDAARLIGCDRNHVYNLQRRLKERGSLAHSPRSNRISQAHRDAVVAFALQHPSMSDRNIAAALRQQEDGGISVSPTTIHNILKTVGLSKPEDRRAAAEKLDPPVTV
ncbi:helix-turn-helix domain-containing protein [Actinoplanes sp. NPDC048791]|uniref:helix-turn-helix domain-containing protein n=1 Tax=Actinoplanes sp. NPDC048791 TaxID=3154623 RepID=UPI00340637F4